MWKSEQMIKQHVRYKQKKIKKLHIFATETFNYYIS